MAAQLPPATLPALHTGRDTFGGADLETMDHRCPRDRSVVLHRVPCAAAEEVDRAVSVATAALAAQPRWGHDQRTRTLLDLASRIADDASSFAHAIATDTGKPVRDARAEVGFAVELVRAAVKFAAEPHGEGWQGAGWRLRRRPRGLVAAVTPWNNPLAIPLGKLAPALLQENALIWKPAPAGAAVAARLFDLLCTVGLPPGRVVLLQGDHRAAARLAGHLGVDAVAFTGSSAAGHALHALCAGRCAPFQGELGGNNAAIVWSDSDLPSVAAQIARSAFGAAGQRCTATRRAIISHRCYEQFLDLLRGEVARLRWGDPLVEETDVGPLISAGSQARVQEVVERARSGGSAVFLTHSEAEPGNGFYQPPAIIGCDDGQAEVVQEETFGPVLVVQRASGWEHAIRLCNGVPQGLVAALFSPDRDLQMRFLEEAHAGMLKLNMPTAGASADAPFGGWKASAIGPFEHGRADPEFYARYQTIYSKEPGSS